MASAEVIVLDSDDDEAPLVPQQRAAPTPPPAKEQPADAACEDFFDLTNSQEVAVAFSPPAKRRRRQEDDDEVIVVSQTRSAAGASTSARGNVVDLSYCPASPKPTEKELLAKLRRLEAELDEKKRREERGVMPPHWKATEDHFFVRHIALPNDAVPDISAKRQEAFRQEQQEASRVVQRWQEGGLQTQAIHKARSPINAQVLTCSSRNLQGEIVRIQNKRLWTRYVDRRVEVAEAIDHAAARSGRDDLIARAATEKLLFHGADLNAIANIVKARRPLRHCSRRLPASSAAQPSYGNDLPDKGGFECRISSMGGALGAGSYFAENSRYSDAYSRMQPHAQWSAGPPRHAAAYYPAQPSNAPPQAAQQAAQAAHELQHLLQIPQGHLLMICARVSLGKVGNATPGGRMAPAGFQSVGDGGIVRASQIYAVFDNFQAYPEWVIVYDPAKVGPNGNNTAGPTLPVPGAGGAAAAAWAGGLTASAIGLAGLLGVPRVKSRGRRR